MLNRGPKAAGRMRYPMARGLPLRSLVREQPTPYKATSSAGVSALQKQSRQPTFIDLFCGCGGFSLGMMRAGFRCLAAIDFNAEAITVFRKNLPDVAHALHKDLTRFPPSELAKFMDSKEVDVIVGGPALRPQRRASGAGTHQQSVPQLNSTN